MLKNMLFAAAILTVAALFVPDLASTYLDRAAEPSAEIQQVSTVQTAKPQPGGRKFIIPADASGHFFADFRINGRSLRGLIDTGASMIAITETMARNLGHTGNRLDFRHTVQTANGTAKAAHLVLDRVEIGGISARNVDAMVLKDGMLTTMLVGMSFLKTLASYQVAGGKLLLVN